MRILIVRDTDWVQRNPMQTSHLAERLVQRGHEVRVIDYEILWRDKGTKELLSKRQTFEVSKVVNGVSIKVIRPPILKIPVLDYVSMLFTYGREIRRQIAGFRPDLLIGNDILTPWLAGRLAKRHDIPVIFYSVDVDHKLVPFRFLQPLGKLLEGKNIRDADLVLSINEGLRDYTIRMGARPDRTKVIRAGIDMASYDPGVSGDAVRDKFGISRTDKVIFFMGWLYHFSGLKEVAIELSKLKDSGLKLLIVGDGDAYGELKEVRARLGLEDRMILAGKQPYNEIPALIAAADVCLLPAHNNEIMRDIVPIKMYEYMAMCKPVIATRLPGVMKEFGSDNGVLYVDGPGDVLKKAIQLLEDGSHREIGKMARQFVEMSDWSRITDEFERTIKTLVKGPA